MHHLAVSGPTQGHPHILLEDTCRSTTSARTFPEGNLRSYDPSNVTAGGSMVPFPSRKGRLEGYRKARRAPPARRRGIRWERPQQHVRIRDAYRRSNLAEIDDPNRFANPRPDRCLRRRDARRLAIRPPDGSHRHTSAVLTAIANYLRKLAVKARSTTPRSSASRDGASTSASPTHT